MTEPIPQQPRPEALKPQTVIIGETPIYLTTPVRIGETDVTSLTIPGADKRANDGIGSTVPLVSELSRKKGEEGQMVDKPLTNLNDFDEVSWDKISGVAWTDESGTTHTISKEDLSLTPAEQIPAEVLPESAEMPTEPKLTLPEKPPALPAKEARNVLETLTEDPNTITIVGLKAYETRALDLADRKMQRMATPTSQERADAARGVWEKSKDAVKGMHDFLFTTIWKQSVGGIYFHEKSRQYYIDMLKAAETPFAEDAIRLAEARAKAMYDKKLADSNFLVKAGTKAVDWFKDKIGVRTTVQKLALEEMSAMKTAGEIKGMETFEREAKAVRLRFGADMDKADQFVRKQLGEKLEILDPENAEHAPLVSGIQTLLKDYASGEIATREDFEIRTKEFFNATLKNVRPDIFAEAELYSSSLFDAAETLRTKMSHEGGLANIDEAMSSMQIRLGLGTMGEVTSLEPTAVEKSVGQIRDIAEWLNKKHVLVPLVFNEATIGSGVAIALSAVNFVKTMPFRIGPLALLTGSAAGGLFAGWREYGQLHKDYLTHLREKESGATFTETQKKRAWFEKFAVQQRSAAEMITTMQSGLYEGDQVKAALTDDELRNVFATVADVHARKAVSETGPKRIGLIQYSNREAIESERSALDITANKALADLETYLASHAEQTETVLGGNTFPDFMVKLTTGQTQVLREGVRAIDSQDDPIKAALNLTASYAPEADIVKRRWPFASTMLTDDTKALGIDAIMEEFKKEARVEATKYGVKAGVIGAAIGGTMHALGSLGHIQVNTETTEHTATIPLSTPTPDHTVPIDNHNYLVPKELAITPHVENGQTFYDAKIDHAVALGLKEDYVIGEHMNEQQFKTALEKMGMTMSEPHKTGELIRSAHDTIPIPHTPESAHLTASLPDGYDIKYVDNAHNWQILDAKDKIIATVNISDNGELSGTADQLAKLKADLAAEGYHIDTRVTGNKVIESVLPKVTETVNPPGGTMMDIKGSELQEGGLWNHFLNQVEGENKMASTNGVKNLFRLYTHGQENANIEVPARTHPDFLQENLRTATYGDTLVEEFNIAKIPPDATIHVPKELFSADAIKQFSEMNDSAITHYQSLVESGQAPMEALTTLENGSHQDKVDALLLRMGYFGRDSDLPTQQELAPLLKEMGLSAEGTPDTTTVVPPATETATPVHQLRLSYMYAEDQPGQIFAKDVVVPLVETTTTFTPEAGVNEAPWLPIFIPYREVLEAATGEVIEAKMKPGDKLMSPFGMEEAYLNKESLEQRKSPRLTENPEAKLSQNEEITWYLSTITPEESQTLESLMAAEHPPLNPDVRAIVTIPVSQAGSNIYQRLSSYAGQTNADGTPIAPERTEFIVFDAHVASPDGAVSGTLPGDTKTEVDRFVADHPEMKVLYATHSYADAPTSGRVKRDVTNFAFSRIATLPMDTPDVAVISDNGTGNTIAPTYVSSVVDTLDANPAVDMVSGQYQLPQEAYNDYPMLFAQHRAFELMDSLVRHGDTDGVPGVYSGNIGVRSGTLAAVGGYNADARVAEDREMAWIIRSARGTSDVMTTLPSLTATIDPTETVYAHLQQLGLADSNVPLAENAVYKDLPWTEMAARANEKYTKEQLEEHLSNMYANMYPTLKATNPTRFDAYFGRTMDALGLPYELQDGKVTILDASTLPANMNALTDVEAFAKEAAVKIVEATPPEPENSREELTTLAGEQSAEAEVPQTVTENVTTGIASPEVPQEAAESAAAEPASPEAPQQQETLPVEVPVAASETPQATEVPPKTPDIMAASLTTETPAMSKEMPPKPVEQLPTGVEDRINFVLNKTNEGSAGVELTTGELMDYVKSSVELPGARITEGKIVIDGTDVKLTDMKAKTIVGEARFDGTLTTDPNLGLTVKKDSLNLHLPMLARPWQKTIHESLDHFNDLVLTHLDGRIDQKWKASRIDVVGDKLQVTFAKKTS